MQNKLLCFKNTNKAENKNVRVCIKIPFCLCSPALAEVLGSKVCLSRDKYNTMCCLESDRIRHLITTDWKAAQVHVLPMMKINFKVRYTFSQNLLC